MFRSDVKYECLYCQKYNGRGTWASLEAIVVFRIEHLKKHRFTNIHRKDIEE